MRKKDRELFEMVVLEWTAPRGLPELRERMKDRVRLAMPGLGRALDDLANGRLSNREVKVGQVWRVLYPTGSKRLIRIAQIDGAHALAVTFQLVDGTKVPSHLQTSSRIALDNMYPGRGYRLVEDEDDK